MNKIGLLIESAKAYNDIVNFKYDIILGRKGRIEKINLIFLRKLFLHLSGINKIINKSILDNYPNILNSIINSDTTLINLIINSNNFEEISPRLLCLINLKDNLHNAGKNKHFQFIKNNFCNNYTSIEFNFLLKCPFLYGNAYYFLRKSENSIDNNEYICISTFIENDKDYSIGQSLMTLLSKSEINLLNNSKIDLYKRFKNNPL